MTELRRWTARALVLCVISAAACARAEAEPGDPARQPPASPRFVAPATVRYHMQDHAQTLRQIERLLLAGELADAKVQAFALAKPEADPGMASWAADARSLTAAARWLAAARDIPEALRAEARVAAACASCHLATQRLPSLPRSEPPVDAAVMARHQWAVDQLWGGIISADDPVWRAGLTTLATAPLPFVVGAEVHAHQVQALARAALARRHRDGPDERAAAYGELLVTCARCHAARDRRPR